MPGTGIKAKQVSTGTPGSIQPDDTAAEGTAGSLARSDHTHGIVAAAPTQGIGGGNSEGAATSFARSNHDHAIRTTTGPTDLTVGAIADGDYLTRSGTTIAGTSAGAPPASSQQSSTTQDAITSTTDVVISGMTVTPASGTYVALFSSEIYCGSKNDDAFVSIYVGGTQVAHSERDRNAAILADSTEVNTQARVTVNGSQAIDVRARVVQGTAYFDNRSLILIKVS